MSRGQLLSWTAAPHKQPMLDDVIHIGDLKPDPKNRRAHNPRNVGMIEDALHQVGAGRSIVIDEDGVILAGNATIEAAAQAGIERVQVVDSDGETIVAVRRTGLSAEQKRDLGLFDNRSAELATWDVDQIVADLDAGFDFDKLFYEDELAAIVAGLDGDGAGPAPDAEDADTMEGEIRPVRGDVWLVESKMLPGRSHRVMCGDSTSAEDVARVMGGERARLVMTSPPYWVGKEYEREKTWQDIQEFIVLLCQRLSEHASHRIVINTGAPPAAHLTGQRAHIRLLLDDYQRELAKHGFLLRYVRIWSKRGGLVHTAPISDCVDQHWEFVGVFYLPKTYEGQRRCGKPWATDGIWDDIPGEMSSHGHIAAYPVELPMRNIRLYTDHAALVFDPFLGSGTTLIAAEQLGRLCYGMEISERYVEVSLRCAEAMGLTVHRAPAPDEAA